MAKKVKKTKKNIATESTKKTARKTPKKKLATQPNEWEARKPVLKFAGTFLATCIIFFLLTNMSWFSSFRAPLLSMYSGISAFVLNIFGYGVSASGPILSSADFSVSIEEGCDAIAPSILYAISVAIFPIAWKVRWRGLLYGLLAITILNLIRIVTLYLTGIHVPSLFEFMHVDFWQAIFIVFTVGIWIYWMRWGTNKLSPQPADA